MEPVSESSLITMWWFQNCIPFLEHVFARLPFQVSLYGGFALNFYIGSYFNPQLNGILQYMKGVEYTGIPANDIDGYIHAVRPEDELRVAEYILKSMVRPWPPTPHEFELLQSPEVANWIARSRYLPKEVAIASVLLNLPENAPFPLLIARIFPFLRNDSPTNRSSHYQLQIAAVTPSLHVLGLSELTFTQEPFPLYPPKPVIVLNPAQLKPQFEALLQYLLLADPKNQVRIFRTQQRIQKIDQFLYEVGYSPSQGGTRRSSTRKTPSKGLKTKRRS